MELISNAILVCPTLNAGSDFYLWVEACNSQTFRPEKVLIIDSSSSDDTVQIAQNENYEISVISRSDFNHGATRNHAWENNADYEYIIYMTQDAILANHDALRVMLRSFEKDNIAAVCGRQLPRLDAGAIEAHARLFNYPAESRTCMISDVANLGLRAVFLSNSFAAYRISALREVGGFPSDVIFGEDMYAAAKLMKAGYSICYAGEACVYHSHDYSLYQEFKRYFDMGVFHAREPWIREEFGGAEREGLKFIASELKYLWNHAFWRIPESILRTILKYVGFRLGRAERHMPLKVKRKISMNPGYFTIE